METSHTAPRCINTLEAGRVRRYHAAPTVEPQTNAEHSWGVLVIALYITCGAASRELLIECAMHDTGEYYGGDSPFDAKRAYPALKSICDKIEADARQTQLLGCPAILSLGDQAVLKMADTLEGFIWCAKVERGSLIWGRWNNSFHNAMEKFRDRVPATWMERAVALFASFGGTPAPMRVETSHPRSHVQT